LGPGEGGRMRVGRGREVFWGAFMGPRTAPALHPFYSMLMTRFYLLREEPWRLSILRLQCVFLVRYLASLSVMANRAYLCTHQPGCRGRGLRPPVALGGIRPAADVSGAVSEGETTARRRLALIGLLERRLSGCLSKSGFSLEVGVWSCWRLCSLLFLFFTFRSSGHLERRRIYGIRRRFSKMEGYFPDTTMRGDLWVWWAGTRSAGRCPKGA
jgi:hypothetical protein